ncbi:hypothetical protein R6V09_51915, partial [Streptomyces sp. W16]|nr:hypothetical protein [Streptomyces sp. W16]
GLLAAGTPPDGLAAALGCDSAEFLELDRLLATAGGDPDDYCTACLTGRFPAAVPRTYQLEPRPEPRPST